MSDKTKMRVAYADAVLRLMWASGLITDQECKNISDNTAKAINNANC